jgi:hypothetical protein
LSYLQQYGFIAQLVDHEGRVVQRVFGYPDFGDQTKRGGKRIVVRKPIGQRVWLRECADYCDKRGLRIQVISTPSSILSDLEGRSPFALRDHEGGFWLSRFASYPPVPFPEDRMLRQIGRSDLIDPSARIAYSEVEHEWRQAA